VLFEPEPTQFDWNFRIFGIRVRVHPLFWLIAVVLGWGLARESFAYLILWILCVFVSILIHELGHIVAGMVFGSSGHIVLYSFGGLAVGSNNLSQRWQRIVVALAGPGAQFILWGLVWMVRTHVLPVTGLGRYPVLVLLTLIFLAEINWWWPLLNLLPIWPLDGGQVSREVFSSLTGGRGVRTALGISLVTAGLLAVNSLAAAYGRPLLPWLYAGGMYGAILFGMLALSNFQELQSETPWKRWDDGEESDWR
jgi:Zn-dependent protease